MRRTRDRTALVAGAGFRRYEYDQEYFTLSSQAVVPRDHVSPTVELGAGAAWNVGRADLFVEAGATSNRFQNDPARPSFGRTVQDYAVTLGFRIPLHR